MMFSLLKLPPSSSVTTPAVMRSKHGRPLAMRELPPLLHVAGELDFGDEAGWRPLCQTARGVVDALIDAGELSWRLRIGPDDPPVVIARTLTVAWREVTAASDRRQHRM